MHKSIHQQQKQKHNEFNKPKKPIIGEFEQAILVLIISCIIFVVGIVVLVIFADSKSQDECDQVGGEYKIVDTTFAGKSAVNIYGCVK